ncbi:hypothetical protein BDV93DRAFT_560544 [Ceratobasidium sp. AG-I]|nr:hypothetical protein BDV93DRAFT_560544 [Ceratobasidium sp. AG-I]
MKLNQIPVVHSIVSRWRHADIAKSHSQASLDSSAAGSPEKRPDPIPTPPSPKSPSKKSVRISEVDLPHRHAREDKGKGREKAVASTPAVPVGLPSPPPSPRISLRPRPAERCSSGGPTSHEEIGEVFRQYGSVSVNETFECADAVDPVRLLTLSRRTLLAEARARGGNALTDEVWEYTVSKRGKTAYVVKVDYRANAVLMKGEGFSDPQKPVAIEIAKTKGVNGLMTVTSRR